MGSWTTSIGLISVGVGPQACGPNGVDVLVIGSMLDIRCALDGCTG